MPLPVDKHLFVMDGGRIRIGSTGHTVAMDFYKDTHSPTTSEIEYTRSFNRSDIFGLIALLAEAASDIKD